MTFSYVVKGETTWEAIKMATLRLAAVFSGTLDEINREVERFSVMQVYVFNEDVPF